MVTPGLIDAHTVVGFTGYLNQPHDQEQVERSGARAAGTPGDRRLRRARAPDRVGSRLGVTTMHTGHGPELLISGQTMIVKTVGDNAEQAVIVPEAMIAATLGETARVSGAGKLAWIAIKDDRNAAQRSCQSAGVFEEEARNVAIFELRPLLPVVSATCRCSSRCNKAEDILSAIRLGKEFNMKLVLDGAADAHLVLDEIKASGYPVFLHPRWRGHSVTPQNFSRETASKLKAKGIPFALQSGFESYVPKTRVVLFEAARLPRTDRVRRCAREHHDKCGEVCSGSDKRVGSLRAGKDGDVAMYDGDPFEYTSHCTGVVIATAKLVCVDSPRLKSITQYRSMAFRGVDYMLFDSLLSEEELLVRQTARRFVDERVLPSSGTASVTVVFPSELIREMARAWVSWRDTRRLWMRGSQQCRLWPDHAGTRAGGLRAAKFRVSAGCTRHVSHLHLWDRGAETALASETAVR